MRTRLLSSLAAIAIAFYTTPALAQSAPKPTISDLSFLVGTWASGTGVVADTGESDRGTSTITSELSGKALLRRDHVDLLGRDGKSTGSFEILMLVYPEGGTMRADYSDGTHIIHYTSATIVPGHSVAFLSGGAPGAIVYRLTYERTTPTTLGVHFEISPLGDGTFRPIATGTLTKT